RSPTARWREAVSCGEWVRVREGWKDRLWCGSSIRVGASGPGLRTRREIDLADRISGHGGHLVRPQLQPPAASCGKQPYSLRPKFAAASGSLGGLARSLRDLRISAPCGFGPCCD